MPRKSDKPTSVKPITVLFPKAQVTFLDRKAEREDRTVSQIMRALVRREMEQDREAA